MLLEDEKENTKCLEVCGVILENGAIITGYILRFLAVAVFTYIRSDSIKNYAALKGLSVTPFFLHFKWMIQ